MKGSILGIPLAIILMVFFILVPLVVLGAANLRVALEVRSLLSPQPLAVEEVAQVQEVEVVEVATPSAVEVEVEEVATPAPTSVPVALPTLE